MPAATGDPEGLTTSERALRLYRPSAAPLWLTLSQQYVLRQVEDERGPWKVSTRGYWYRIDDEDGEFLAWHWHPLGLSRERRPHLHVYRDPYDGRLHLPTARVGVEAVVRLLVDELDVQPRRDDWVDVVDEAERAFLQWRSWSTEPPNHGG